MKTLICAGLEDCILCTIGSSFKFKGNKRNYVRELNCLGPLATAFLYLSNSNMRFCKLTALLRSNGTFNRTAIVLPVRDAGSAINGDSI